MPMQAKKHDYHGNWLTAAEIAKANGLSTQALYSRMNAHKELSIIEAAEMVVSTRGHRHAQTKHRAAGLALTLSEWSERLKVKYSTLVKWVRDEGIVSVVERVQAGQTKPRKDDSPAGKKRLRTPDISALVYQPDLELTRRLAAYRKQGVRDEVILDRERRASYGNGR